MCKALFIDKNLKGTLKVPQGFLNGLLLFLDYESIQPH